MVLAGILFLAGAACDDGPSHGDIPREGVILASGAGAPWNLLSIPRDGGPAGLVAFGAAPDDSTLWQGSASISPARQVHRIGSRHLALLRSDGRVERYDPARDLISRVGQIDPSSAWTSHEQWGLFRSPDGLSLLQVAPGGAWTYGPDRPAVWASPARDGSVVALLGGSEGDEGGTLVRYEPGGTEPASRLEEPIRPPAVVTGFGGQVAAVRRDEGGQGWELVLVDLPGLEVAGFTSLPGHPDALATSPSYHEIYVAVGDRLLVLGRPDLRLRAERSLPASSRALRPGLLGGPLLSRSDGGVHVIPWDADPRAVESEWRSDLPLALPDGSVLAVRGEGVVRTGTDGAGARTVGPAGRWWIPVRWSLPETGGVGGDTVAAAIPAEGVAGDTAAGTPVAEGDTGEAESEPGAEPGLDVPPPGFYAVVAAARDREGVERLLAQLRSDGWRTDIHEWRDDAGTSWHRGLVGPFETRPEAESAARQLQRERDLSVWVKELGPGLAGEP